MAIYDLLIVGAGPAGLAAAIAAQRAGLKFCILEKGSLVNSIFRFPSQMVFFTTPDLLEIGGLPFVTPHGKPTRDVAKQLQRGTGDLQVPDRNLEASRCEPARLFQTDAVGSFLEYLCRKSRLQIENKGCAL